MQINQEEFNQKQGGISTEYFNLCQARFEQLSEKIRKFAELNRGSVILTERFLKQFYFYIPKVILINQKLFLELKFHNNCCKIQLQISVQTLWSDIKNIGVSKIYQYVNFLNNQEKYPSIYEFNEQKKCILFKILSYNTFCNSEIMKILESSIGQVKNILMPVLKKQKSKEKQDKKKFLVEMIEYLRLKQQYATQQIKLYSSQLHSNLDEKINPDNTAKSIYFGIVQGYSGRLKEKFKSSPNILRCMKILNETVQRWKSSDGQNSLVEKVSVSYQISKDFSINIRTNKHIEQAKINSKISQQQNDNSNNRKAQSTEVTIEGTLIRKKPTQQMEQMLCFCSEVKLLVIIRAQKCTAINNFYCKPCSFVEQVNQLYSDYHGRTLQYTFSNARSYLKLLYTLCQGLVFFQWNGISHRDLKPTNILVSKNYEAKIIDFGSGCHNKSYRKIGNLRVVSPVLYSNKAYNLFFSALPETVKATFFHSSGIYDNHPHFDVYAFGKIIQRLFMTEQKKAQLGEYIWECLRYLAQICMQPNPSDRPSPENIYVFLGEIIRSEDAQNRLQREKKV